MSQGRTNAGCGITQPFAAIAVTYPKGDIVTCSDGKITLGAKNSNGRWIFSIPYAGIWTVRSYNDLYPSTTESFDVVQNGIYEAKIEHEILLFGEGQDYSLTGGSVIEKSFDESSVSVAGDTVTIVCCVKDEGDSRALDVIHMRTANRINLDNASRIEFNITDNNYAFLTFAIIDEIEEPQYYVRAIETEYGATGIKSLDVSDISGLYYVYIKAYPYDVNQMLAKSTTTIASVKCFTQR